jgi:hypothetical protein
VAEPLRPLRGGLIAQPHPRSALTWLRNRDVRDLLSSIATGARPLAHTTFDDHASPGDAMHLRELFIQHGLLAPMDRNLAGPDAGRTHQPGPHALIKTIRHLAPPAPDAPTLRRRRTELGHYPGSQTRYLRVQEPSPASLRTRKTARLLDELKKAHPGVEIESCSTGGARVDLGILELTERIWASDCNDALERQSIQRWSGLVVPPELVGGHIGPTTSQTTARTHDLSFRAITALFGQFGTARARTRTEGLRNLSRNPGRTQRQNIILRGRTSNAPSSSQHASPLCMTTTT